MNRTERYVKRFYTAIGIVSPSQLNIKEIAAILCLDVRYWEYSSEVARYKNRYKMFINEKQNEMKQWQDFGHEMYHYCHDHVSYDLLHESYSAYGESKADYFAYHFCVPTFMLLQFKEVSIDVIANKFNVEYDFALRRFEMHNNKLMDRRVKHAVR